MTDWRIVIEDHETGKKFAVNKKWFIEFLGLNQLEHNLKMLKFRVIDLERPRVKERVCELLAREGVPRTYNYIFRRIKGATPSIFDELVLEHKIEALRSHTRWMYRAI